MSSVFRTSYTQDPDTVAESKLKEIIGQRKWQTVDIKISLEDLKKNIWFLNDAVVLRQSSEGVPLMTTTAIYGPIHPHKRVVLTPGEGTGVMEIPNEPMEISLIEELENLARNAQPPKEGNATTVNSNWVSSDKGGRLPNLDPAANVFGQTGSLYVNESAVIFPVMDPSHPDYEETLAFYGARLLRPKEPFYMGFKDILFGMEYNTSLPDYIRNYALSPIGGGGMFVEHHPFPHIFLPKPNENGAVYCEAKVTLGHKVEVTDPEKENPRIIFTTFRVPADGSALAIKPSTIHNDSFTNGKLAVFVANTPADTVAFRQTAPFTNIVVKDNAPQIEKPKIF
ncbi:hypothetical protein [uncultured Pedobacter sp.]|uniref:hypothetical protein n=1 Tax=uncultured Pedobacter sp. TaxID=246139 RepID=UPI0025FCFBBC|nr:hypothetical protein [uncultured Pedobacter sp.]